jgi:asparagine synthase (glutamine-hydrolysing)
MSFQSVYPKETVFEDIYHVLPGHYGVYMNGSYEEISYVNIPFDQKGNDSYQEAVNKVEGFLQNSVKKCIGTDKMGILLSGGMDSAVVAAMAPEGMLKQAFCLKPVTRKGSLHQKEEDAYFSEKLAKKYGLMHHVIEMTPMDLVEGIDEIIESFSQPFSGTVSGYFLYKHIAKECNWILTGDGADELFGSYRHHSVTIPLEKYVSMKEKGEIILGKDKSLAPYEDKLAFLEALYQYGGINDTLWYYRLLPMGDNEKSLFLSKDRFGEYMDKKSTLELCLEWDRKLKSYGVLNRSLERDFKHLLPGHTMLYQDTLARKFGINLVMPFLDNGLIDYIVTLPEEYKIKEGITKSILKDVARKHLQDEIVERRKEPFTLPVLEWLSSDLKEYVTDILCEENIKRYDLFDADSVLYALNEYYKYPNEKSYYGEMLWGMAMLQKWAMLYM